MRVWMSASRQGPSSRSASAIAACSRTSASASSPCIRASTLASASAARRRWTCQRRTIPPATASIAATTSKNQRCRLHRGGAETSSEPAGFGEAFMGASAFGTIILWYSARRVLRALRRNIPHGSGSRGVEIHGMPARLAASGSICFSASAALERRLRFRARNRLSNNGTATFAPGPIPASAFIALPWTIWSGPSKT